MCELRVSRVAFYDGGHAQRAEGTQAPSFDLVRAGDRELTVEEFLALPLPDRVRLILRPDLVFTLGGASVPRDVALQGLMRRT